MTMNISDNPGTTGQRLETPPAPSAPMAATPDQLHLQIISLPGEDTAWTASLFEGVAADGQGPVNISRLSAGQGELPQTALADVLVADVLLMAGGDVSALRDAINRLRHARLAMPIVALTEARDSAVNAALLHAGFDDVFHRDMHPAEILARVKALHVRSNSYNQPHTIARKRKPSDLWSRQFEQMFTPRERDVVKLLQERQGTLVTYDEIFDHLEGERDPKSVKSLRVAVSNIRQKIHDTWTISSVSGLGYVLLQR